MSLWCQLGGGSTFQAFAGSVSRLSITSLKLRNVKLRFVSSNCIMCRYCMFMLIFQSFRNTLQIHTFMAGQVASLPCHLTCWFPFFLSCRMERYLYTQGPITVTMVPKQTHATCCQEDGVSIALRGHGLGDCTPWWR